MKRRAKKKSVSEYTGTLFEVSSAEEIQSINLEEQDRT